MPGRPGDVIVTWRNHRGQAFADAIQIEVFTLHESLDFPHWWGPGITSE